MRSPAGAGAETQGHGVVELTDTARLLARHELVDQSGTRERALRELRERPIACLVVRRPPQDEPERRVDELGVGDLVRGELRGEPRVHHV